MLIIILISHLQVLYQLLPNFTFECNSKSFLVYYHVLCVCGSLLFVREPSDTDIDSHWQYDKHSVGRWYT